LSSNLITPNTALSMPGGPTVLLQESHGCFTPYEPYFSNVFRALDDQWPSASEARIIDDLAAFGEHLLNHPALPWINGPAHYAEGEASQGSEPANTTIPLDRFSRSAYLGAAAIIAIMSESSRKTFQPLFRALPDLVPYQYFRRDAYQPAESTRQGNPGILGPQFRRSKTLLDVNKLPDLPVPYKFERIFRDWAAVRITVVGMTLKLRKT
jgi:hypothetical protein